MEREPVFDLLTLLGLELTAAATQGCAAMGLTPTEARVLTCVAEGEHRRLGDVARCLRISSRRMTQVVDGLEAKSHLSRAVDPADARARVLNLSPSGVELAAQIAEYRTIWAGHLLGHLSDEQLSVVSGALSATLGRFGAPRSH